MLEKRNAAGQGRAPKNFVIHRRRGLEDRPNTPEFQERRPQPIIAEHWPWEDDAKFVDRHADWLKRRDEAKGKADIIVAKQRMGAIRTVSVHFNEERTSFGNLAR